MKENNYNFDAKQVTEKIVTWINDWFNQKGSGCNAIIGMSGGKDSTIVAKLCCEALGSGRVLGLAMPDSITDSKGNKTLQDINNADKICNDLGIKLICAPINNITDSVMSTEVTMDNTWKLNVITIDSFNNIQSWARTMMISSVSRSTNSKISCNINLSKSYIGYTSGLGGNIGDFAPIANLTETEVLQIGKYLGYSDEFLSMKSIDGLTYGIPYEDKIGITFDILDKYIRGNEELDQSIKDHINLIHKSSFTNTDFVDKFEL